LTGGAFLAQMIAGELDAGFSFAERRTNADRSVAYSITPALRTAMRGKRVALVDDAISAGSAVRATLADLEACGATVVVVGALILVGGRAQGFAADRGLPLEWLERVQNPLWDPSDCPLCAAGEPLNQMWS
jgi:orotate phosphoribosyltransferase